MELCICRCSSLYLILIAAASNTIFPWRVALPWTVYHHFLLLFVFEYVLISLGKSHLNILLSMFEYTVINRTLHGGCGVKQRKRKWTQKRSRHLLRFHLLGNRKVIFTLDFFIIFAFVKS